MRKLVLLSMAVAALTAVATIDAAAATVDVTMNDYFFSPQTVKVVLGSTVNWTNDATQGHTATSDGRNDGTGLPGVGLWTTSNVAPGVTKGFTFIAAGQFPYHCTYHYSLGMVGTVTVPMKAGPPSGVVGTTFRIRWATVAASGPFVYDVQRRDPGGTFQDWQVGVTFGNLEFTPDQPGKYSFRARVRNTDTGGTSGYSPTKSISVTSPA